MHTPWPEKQIWSPSLRILDWKKDIKIEDISAYSPEINRVAEQTNSLNVEKARWLLLDEVSKINESFWPEALWTRVYFFNRSSFTVLKFDCQLSVWLKVNNSFQDDYIQDITLLTTFSDRVYFNIQIEKLVKSSKLGLVSCWKGFYVEYTTTTIYVIYFPDICKFEIIKHLEFVEFSNSNDWIQAYRREDTHF